MKAKTAKTTDADLFDGNAPQRIPLEITEGSERFETAHHIGPVTDTVFLEFIDSVDPNAEDSGDLETKLNDAVTELWRKIVKSVEAIEVDPGTDFRDAIEFGEIEAVIQSVMGVTVLPPTAVSGVRNLSAKATAVVRTQALLSGKVTQQSHTLSRKTDEYRKKYERIYSGIGEGDTPKQGIRAKAKAALYDELIVKAEGFKGKVPLRFKTVVIDNYFDSAIAAKK